MKKIITCRNINNYLDLINAYIYKNVSYQHLIEGDKPKKKKVKNIFKSCFFGKLTTNICNTGYKDHVATIKYEDMTIKEMIQLTKT